MRRPDWIDTLRTEVREVEPDPALLARLTDLSSRSVPAPRAGRSVGSRIAMVLGGVIAIGATSWAAGALPGTSPPWRPEEQIADRPTDPPSPAPARSTFGPEPTDEAATPPAATPDVTDGATPSGSSSATTTPSGTASPRDERDGVRAPALPGVPGVPSGLPTQPPSGLPTPPDPGRVPDPPSGLPTLLPGAPVLPGMPGAPLLPRPLQEQRSR